ncbi:MAG: esterase/lipase family protein [Pikeienuella sp.]
MLSRLYAFAILGAVSLLSACAEEAREPNLRQIYDYAGRTDSPDRRPIIAIPGTLGSRLLDRTSGTIIWGGRGGLSIDPANPRNQRLLALPIGEGEEPLSELRDNVRTSGVLRVARPSVLGLELERDVYRGAIDTLIAGGYDFRRTRQEEIDERVVNLDSFEFPYDWRRDIVESAQELDDFITRKTRQVAQARQKAFGTNAGPFKFDIMAHSMGALVARYYLMYGAADLPADGSMPELTWAGAKNVSRVIYVAPPNAGSVISFENLVNGKSFGPLQPEFSAALIGTHVATYQLLPRPRHGRITVAGDDTAPDIYDVEDWARHGWGLLDPRQDVTLQKLMPDEPTAAGRHRRAKAHLAKILQRTRQFHRAMDRPAIPPDGLDAYLVVGGGVDTISDVVFDPVAAKVKETAWEEGDGVVLRASSLLDERQAGNYALGLRSPLSFRTVLLLPEEHLEITQSPVFGDNVLFWLLDGPRGDWAATHPPM